MHYRVCWESTPEPASGASCVLSVRSRHRHPPQGHEPVLQYYKVGRPPAQETEARMWVHGLSFAPWELCEPLPAWNFIPIVGVTKRLYMGLNIIVPPTFFFAFFENMCVVLYV